MAKTNIEKLADVLDKVSGVYVKEISRVKNFHIILKYKEEKVLKFIEEQLQIASEHSEFETELNPDEIKISFSNNEKERNKTISLLIKQFNNITNNKNLKSASEKELGLPDLSLCTITQMAEELKTRENVNFALVWIENSEKDNISLQAKGNATQIIGLLARGQQIALDWTNQNLKYKKKND